MPDKENDQESVEDQQNVAADESDGSNERVRTRKATVIRRTIFHIWLKTTM